MEIPSSFFRSLSLTSRVILSRQRAELRCSFQLTSAGYHRQSFLLAHTRSVEIRIYRTDQLRSSVVDWLTASRAGSKALRVSDKEGEWVRKWMKASAILTVAWPSLSINWIYIPQMNQQLLSNRFTWRDGRLVMTNASKFYSISHFHSWQSSKWISLTFSRGFSSTGARGMFSFRAPSTNNNWRIEGWPRNDSE